MTGLVERHRVEWHMVGPRCISGGESNGVDMTSVSSTLFFVRESGDCLICPCVPTASAALVEGPGGPLQQGEQRPGLPAGRSALSEAAVPEGAPAAVTQPAREPVCVHSG